ncbi:unnamed protein product [Cuscuta epithymum]|uniref:Uncharacterized protein n=1 Tax=Cuscuta epithymum TaxID=186058 RepID=A0AAV0DK78_9ASTE|nr:unnamed protein product [Cuscuta epithymum]
MRQLSKNIFFLVLLIALVSVDGQNSTLNACSPYHSGQPCGDSDNCMDICKTRMTSANIAGAEVTAGNCTQMAPGSPQRVCECAYQAPTCSPGASPPHAAASIHFPKPTHTTLGLITFLFLYKLS